MGDRPLGASTLGAPHESLDVALTGISQSGLRLVELRAAVDADHAVTLNGETLHSAAASLERNHLSALALASYLRVAAKDFDWDEARCLVDAAARLGAGFLRVFPGGDIWTDRDSTASGDPTPADRRAGQRLRDLSEFAHGTGVVIALETHDSHPRGEDIARVLRAVPEGSTDHGHVGVIWDILHPWRMGESFEDSWAFLGSHLTDGRGYIQLKDVASRTDTTPVLPGGGAIPLTEFMQLLEVWGYRGPVSLEWERAWYPDIAPLPEAIAALQKLIRARS